MLATSACRNGEENLELAVQWRAALKPGQRRKLEIGSPRGHRGKGEGFN